ncbi:unnamed protein product [Enterobius vermicularis]|uniref:NADH dehydrogenase [ubiquinone] 1 alpha subcomplex subunit 12 n=1 Tax=Enterobius vermicularis TaxID=51028 RepID=A0A0N4VNS3_ENTVE|nr:unnamed protein product [Enterobius vermicularis]
MSRPGVWHTVWMNFKKSLAAREMKKYVGEDVHGNRYYQILGKRKSVMRGYDPKSLSSPEPSVEWLAWLKGTRKHPPSGEEARVRTMNQQAQSVEDANLARNAPRVEVSRNKEAASISYPRYPDLEDQPGVHKRR